jgi:HK97 family phage major capsid protein
MKPLTELGRQAVRIGDTNKVAEFMRLAIAIGCSRQWGDDIRTKARRMSPRLDAILGDTNEVFRLTPQQVVDFERAAVGAGSTTDTSFADALAGYQVVTNAFAESLRNFGAFDAMLPFMRRVPLHSRAGMSTTGFTASTVAQHHPKPITKLSMTATTLDEKKAVALCVLTEELMRFSMMAVTDFQTELQNALAVETDETFIEILTSGATSFGSSGVTAEHVRNDLRAALGSITTGARSKLYLLMPSALAKVLAVLYDESGGAAFPTMKVNGGDIAGMTVIVSDGVPSSTIILADATQIAAASETITLTSSNETTLQMDTTPDSPPIASTAYVNLWQMNWRALRAERWFGASKLSTTGVCVITSVNWIGGSPG